ANDTLSLHDALPISISMNSVLKPSMSPTGTSSTYCATVGAPKMNEELTRPRMVKIGVRWSPTPRTTRLGTLALRSESVSIFAARSEEHTSELQSPDH